MSAHTPGPWIVRNDNEGMPREYGPLWVIESQASISDDEEVPYMEAILHHGCIFDANLIAAAPEMLEMLQNLDAWLAFRPDLTSRAEHDKVKALIAKATGSEK